MPLLLRRVLPVSILLVCSLGRRDQSTVSEGATLEKEEYSPRGHSSWGGGGGAGWKGTRGGRGRSQSWSAGDKGGRRNSRGSMMSKGDSTIRCESGGHAKLIPFSPDSEAISVLRDLLKVKRNKQLGRGGDTGKFPKYQDIALVAAWQVDNPGINKKYQEAKDLIDPTDMMDAEVPATGDILSIPGTKPLDTEWNERYFFHGTKPVAVESIACTGLREGGGLFGQGVYLADVPEKFDQYTTYPEPETPGETLMEKLGGQPIHEPQGELFYAFVVRSLLGHTFEGQCNCNDGMCGNSSAKCNRCGWVEQFSTGVKLKSRWRAKIVQPLTPRGSNGQKGYAPDSDEGWQYNSLCVQKKPRTCIQRFNECIVPKGSNRAQVQILFAYERCHGKVVQGRCDKAVTRLK